VDIGDVAGTATAAQETAVRKRGRTTELTFGTVDDTNLTVTIPYGAGVGSVTLTDQIGIDADAGQNASFGRSGDSGSVVVDAERRVVGLYFAGSVEETDSDGNVIAPEGAYGIANPIQDVLDALNVDMCVPVLRPAKPILKELKSEKFEKFEVKELKLEKVEKPELKELKRDKLEKAELGDLMLEKRVLADWIDPKMLRETDLPEMPREPIEPVRPVPPVEGGPRGSVEQRLDSLESTVGKLLHFISTELRPDLSRGALSREPDQARALSSELRKQAKDSKEAKDNKDIEKMAER
jgi:hypothetical protein